MKSLIKYFLISILVFYSFSPVFSQQYYNQTSMTTYRIERTTYSYGGSPIYTSSSYSYGYSVIEWSNANPPYTEYKEVVTFYEFNFNFLPSDAYNIVVKIESYRSSGSGTSKFVKTVDNVSSNDEARYNAVNNGNELFSVNNSSGTWHNITSSVSSNIASRGKVNFGIRRADTQYGRVTTYILVEWDAPSHITAKNNFSGGVIKVGVNGNPLTKNSPYNFSANVGSTINLRAVEQNNGGYYRLWNDTEAPLNKSKWEK